MYILRVSKSSCNHSRVHLHGCWFLHFHLVCSGNKLLLLMTSSWASHSRIPGSASRYSGSEAALWGSTNVECLFCQQFHRLRGGAYDFHCLPVYLVANIPAMFGDHGLLQLAEVAGILVFLDPCARVLWVSPVFTLPQLHVILYTILAFSVSGSWSFYSGKLSLEGSPWTEDCSDVINPGDPLYVIAQSFDVGDADSVCWRFLVYWWRSQSGCIWMNGGG